MIQVLCLAFLGVMWATPGGAAEDRALADFFGDWYGRELVAEGVPESLPLTGKDLDVRIEPNGDGFRMRWTAIARKPDAGGELVKRPIEASFAPTERSGVYGFDSGGGSLLGSLFADPATGNPLEGETLLWARLEGATLSVYSLSIAAHGGYDLDHYRRSLTDAGLAVRYVHRFEDADPVIVEGLLVRAGE